MAHGTLLVGFISTVSTLAITLTRDADETPVAIGFDKVRYLAPVFLGDTVTVAHEFEAINLARERSTADITVTNQKGDLVAVAKRLLQRVPN